MKLGPDFKALQEVWYKKLLASGFKDIEDLGVNSFEDGRPLKNWECNWTLGGGHETNQAPGSPVTSSWPEPVYRQEEELLNHPNFKNICERLFSHGNSACTITQIVSIWGDYCEGDSQRIIGKRYGVSDTAIFRITHKLIEWMHMTDLDSETSPSESKVIIRSFIPESDAAFLYSSWRNSLWYDQDRDPSQSQKFYTYVTREIKNIISKKECKIKIACLSDDPDLIIGYSVLTGTNLEWCYVKIEYRKKGIANLITKGFHTISQPMTRIGKSIALNHALKIKEIKKNEDGEVKTDR